jgi:hypothetical protein
MSDNKEDVKRCIVCGWALREDELHMEICFRCYCEQDGD